MLTKEDKTQTGFLEWVQIGTSNNMWVADDPVDPDIRWVIQKSYYDNPTMKYKSVYMKKGEQHFVSWYATLNRSQWSIVAKRLMSITKMAFEPDKDTPQDISIRCWKFISKLASDKDLYVG